PIVQLAHAHRIGLTIDMESRAWTDRTLARSIELFEMGHDVGTVLQTRLNRTKADLDSIPRGMRIRLVIGIYPEPSDVATTDKPQMKERMLQYAERLLQNGVRVEFATHDDAYVERFAKELAPQFPGQCEVQMLLGVPRAPLQVALLDGSLGAALPVRLYVPFAVSWTDATAYLRRRMNESPSIIWLVLRNLFDRQATRPPPRLPAKISNRA
ncbi:MAG: proline dehydrogenase family protein, partial [Myxococcota bacterium]